MLSVINKIATHNLRYNVAIAGPIGSGKTTLCDYIWKQLNDIDMTHVTTDKPLNEIAHYYKEWIDHSDICKQMLVNRTNGLISRFTLQSFILDEWDNIMKKDPLRNFNLFERSISECSMCFCEDLSFKEYDVLHSREYEIASKYDIPCVDRTFGFHITESIDTADIYDEIIKRINNDVDYMIHEKINSFNRIIGMKLLEPEVLVKRIGKRARPGEEDLQLRRMREHVDVFKHAYYKFENRSILDIPVVDYNDTENAASTVESAREDTFAEMVGKVYNDMQKYNEAINKDSGQLYDEATAKEIDIDSMVNGC